MSKLLILKGLPASGKSTRARELVETGGNWVRVNRDLIRTILHFDKWTPRNEEATVNAELAMALEMLANKKNVVVDDTNLGQSHVDMWKNLAAKIPDAHVQIENMKTGMWACIERDEKREKKVGQHVIVRMALEYGLFKPDRPFVLCDIDGTIADISHRLHYVKDGNKDWKNFFAEIGEDSLRVETLNKLEEYYWQGFEIIFVTARPEDYRRQTEEWLKQNVYPEIEWLTVIMRRSGDSRDDAIVKREMYEKYFKDKYEIEAVFDDRPKVIRMWREQGLKVIDVGSGIEF